MNNVKINYDEDADILYVSFGRSDHITGIELAENILLRIDTGKANASTPSSLSEK